MTTSSRVISILFVLAAGSLVLAGCNLDPWETGSGGKWRDAGPAPDGDITGDASVVVDACVPVDEVCDEADNDCDGVIDNGYDLQNDVANCGTCGNVCEYFGGLAGCQSGGCTLVDCLPGYHNLDGNDANGCEYYLCFETFDGTEICDGVDNDCDGQADEDFDLTTDPDNCGGCNNVCVFLNGNGACVGGQCNLGSCLGGFVDLDNSVNNGCECQMDIAEDATPMTACVQGGGTCGTGELCADPNRDGLSHCLEVPLDLCDGRDNDCDGVTDEDATALLATTDCYTFASGCTDTGSGYDCDGPCASGTLTCVNSRLQCFNQVGPESERCDDVDNDCNGTVDDQWDKINDPNNCGGCGNVCSFANAVAGCRAASTPSGAECYMVACLPGYWDDDTTLSTGCEYACNLSNGGVEKCGDNLDNDCDGETDENFFLTTDADNCGACGFSCEINRPTGTLVAPTNTCDNGTCRYICDTDSYDIDGDIGLGVTTGSSNNTNGCEYLCTPTSPPTEVCDGEDNDCDMEVDEDTDFDNEVANCGTCGYDCSTKIPDNAKLKGSGGDGAGCSGGQCQFECLTGFVDTNFDLHVIGSDGCDCEVTPEDCNTTADDDCNGVANDPGSLNCTTYYRDLDQDNYGNPNDATCLCEENVNLRYTATQADDCLDTNSNINPLGTEVCDGLDNDCDGNDDNATPGNAALLSRACYTGPSGTMGVGICVGSTHECDTANGRWPDTCPGEQTPLAEVCDGVDNNCDGDNNENTDFQNDKFNCGGCGNNCDTIFTARDGSLRGPTACSAGTCIYSSCTPPYHNWNSDPTTCETYCNPQGPPICGDSGDNNCNNVPDADEFDHETNPYHCGSCGNVCAAGAEFGMEVDTSGGTTTGCVNSNCVYKCKDGFVDLDGGVAGCECIQTNGGVEVCDDEDNDCNGVDDDGIDKNIDPLNCGNCDFVCAELYTGLTLSDYGVEVDPSGACDGGVCRFTCLEDYYDHNSDLDKNQAFGSGVGETDGCEYHCDTDGSGAEVCDGLDNDCDGTTDRNGGGNLLSQDCYTGSSGCTGNPSAGYVCAGVCREGVSLCEGSGGYGTCIGQVTPLAPQCGSSADNDCDGFPDSTQFDLLNDVFNCGSCGNNCYDSAPLNMVPDVAGGACDTGTCKYVCKAGYRDLDGATTPGCEQVCEVYPYLDHEECNGLDDDCDGVADESTDMEAAPDAGTYCSYPRPAASTPCDGVTVTCSNGPGGGYPKDWYCVWPSSDVQYDTLRPNVVLPVETLCDDADNDCDGFVDETFVLKGTPCDDGDLGACKGTGDFDCNGAQDDVECVITDNGANPTQELCNNVDDDCDGDVDESKVDDLAKTTPDGNYVVDDMIQVGAVWVYAYEASRPDADGSDEGAAGHRSCSNTGVIPWSKVSYVEAEAACVAAGYRLCTAAEWQTSCTGTGPARNYPYGASYQAEMCNGNDYDYDCTGPLDDDDLLATGLVNSNCSASPTYECVTPEGVWDLSGNLMEWTSTSTAAGVYEVRGGSFLTHEWGLSCHSNFVSLDEGFRYDDLGFRCCSDTDPN